MEWLVLAACAFYAGLVVGSRRNASLCYRPNHEPRAVKLLPDSTSNQEHSCMFFYDRATNRCVGSCLVCNKPPQPGLYLEVEIYQQ